MPGPLRRVPTIDLQDDSGLRKSRVREGVRVIRVLFRLDSRTLKSHRGVLNHESTRMNTNVKQSIRVHLCSFVVPGLETSLHMADT